MKKSRLHHQAIAVGQGRVELQWRGWWPIALWLFDRPRLSELPGEGDRRWQITTSFMLVIGWVLLKQGQRETNSRAARLRSGQ